MTDTVYEYVTSASTRGTVHVRRQHPRPTTRTLCGTYIPSTWTLEDETVSAHRVTCIACQRRIDADRKAPR